MKKLALLSFLVFAHYSSAQVNASFILPGIGARTVLSINDSLIYTFSRKVHGYEDDGVRHFLLRLDGTVRDSITHTWVDSIGIAGTSPGVYSHAVQVSSNSIIVGYSIDTSHSTTAYKNKIVISKLKLFPYLDTVKTEWLMDKNVVGCDNYFFSRIELENDTLVVASGFCQKTIGNYYSRYFVIEMDTNLNVIRDSLYDRPALNFSLREYLKTPDGGRIWGGGGEEISLLSVQKP